MNILELFVVIFYTDVVGTYDVMGRPDMMYSPSPRESVVFIAFTYI